MVLSLTIAEICVLLTALDVANLAGAPGCNVPIFSIPANVTFNVTTLNDTEVPTNVSGTTTIPFQRLPCSGSLDTASMWSAMFYVIALFVGLIIPFNIFFYEAGEAGRKFQSKLCEALQYQGVALVLAGLTLGLMYWQINQYSYPISTVPIDLNTVGGDDTPAITCSGVVSGCFPDNLLFDPNSTIVIAGPAGTFNQVSQTISNVPNTFGVYLGCFMAFIGWWLFCIYTGTGLVTLPIDLIRSYFNRPKYIPKDVYIKLREDIKRRLEELLKVGTNMKQERKRFDDGYSELGYRERYSKSGTQKTMFREFKKQVEQLEAEYEDIRICHEAWSTYNPLIPIFKLIMGIFSAIFSVCWVLQIVLFILPQYWPTGFSIIPTYFLNDLITWGLIYSGFSLLGVIFIAIFGLYLFACNVNGNFKIGLKFLIMDIHPMKVGATYMSSFLVNVLLLLLQTPALINFIALSFSNSFVLTDIDTIMNNMVRYTTFFVYFFDNNVFIFLLLAFVVLASCLMYAIPDEGKKAAKRLKARVEKMQNDLESKEKESNKRIRGIGLKDITEKAKRANEAKTTAEEEGDDRLQAN